MSRAAAQRGWPSPNFLAKFCKFLAGSFSAVSKRKFATKYAFDSIFHALQDLHPFAPLQSQFFFFRFSLFFERHNGPASAAPCQEGHFC